MAWKIPVFHSKIQTFGTPNLQLPWFRTIFEAFFSLNGQFYLTTVHLYVKTLPIKPKKHFTFYNPDMLKCSTVPCAKPQDKKQRKGARPEIYIFELLMAN